MNNRTEDYGLRTESKNTIEKGSVFTRLFLVLSPEFSVLISSLATHERKEDCGVNQNKVAGRKLQVKKPKD
jgi:hypothetical protein